ncbi:MAG: CD225/dispanin family protein [Myxococcota bacterium]|nr:CD225/dispanin family protein [Myxococcota bacterium]
MADPPPESEAERNLRINASLAVALGVLCTLCCCLPGGIAGTVLAHQARKAIARGSFPDAAHKTRASFLVSGLCIAFGLLFFWLWAFTGLFSELGSRPP